MTVTPFKFPPAPPTPGQAFSPAPFDKIVTAVTPTWVPDPLNRRAALLKMTCRQHDGRSEMIRGIHLGFGDEGWLCVEYHLDRTFCIDPVWVTISQIHYIKTLDVPEGSPMSQLVARQPAELVASLRANPGKSQWGGADIPLLPLPSGRLFVVHHAIGGKIVGVGASALGHPSPGEPFPSILLQDMIWPADCFADNVQVGVYRGQTQPLPTTVYLAGVGFASTYAEASQLAGWTNLPPDEYAQARVEMENFKNSSPHVWSALDHTLKGLGH